MLEGLRGMIMMNPLIGKAISNMDWRKWLMNMVPEAGLEPAQR